MIVDRWSMLNPICLKPSTTDCQLLTGYLSFPVNTLHFFLSDFLTLACISRIPSTVPGFNFFALLNAPVWLRTEIVIQLFSESSTGSFIVASIFSIQSHDSCDTESITFWPLTRRFRMNNNDNATISCRIN